MLTFWNNNHPLMKKAKEFDKLVPAVGKCETQRGELWRAACKLYYDAYNNGFGNNMTHAAQFLIDNVPTLTNDVKALFYQYANCITMGEMYDAAEKTLQSMMEQVINHIEKNVSPETPAIGDMLKTKVDLVYFDSYEDEDAVEEYVW